LKLVKGNLPTKRSSPMSDVTCNKITNQPFNKTHNKTNKRSNFLRDNEYYAAEPSQMVK